MEGLGVEEEEEEECELDELTDRNPVEMLEDV